MNETELKKLIADYKSGKQLTSDQIKSIQKFLKDEGLDLGDFGDDKDGIDGKLGSVTKKAIDDYINRADDKSSAKTAQVQKQDDSEPTTQPQTSVEKSMEALAKETEKEKDEYEQKEKAEEDLKKDIEYRAADVYNISKGALDLGSTIESINQIRRGIKARQALEGKRPKMPTQATSEDVKEATRLSAAMAQKGFGEQTLGAMRQKQLTDYANALKVAQSTGQAGTTLSAASQLYRNTLGANVDAAIANEQARATNLSQYGAMAGVRANELAKINTALNEDYAQRVKDYNQKMGIANVLERTGRINLNRQLSTVPTTLSNLARTYYRKNEQRGIEPLRGTPEREAYDLNRTAQKDYNDALQVAKRQEARRQILDNAVNQQRTLGLSDPRINVFNDTYTPYYGGVGNNE